MRKKPIYKSATVWVNFIVLFIAIFDHDFFSVFGFDDDTIAKFMMLGMKLTALANIYMRIFLTKTKIGNDETTD
jgi:hypothetical protein